MRNVIFYIKHKDMLRLEWERIFKSLMYKRGLLADDFPMPFRTRTEEAPGAHQSRLITRLGRRGALLSVSAGELFMAGYLARHPKASSVDEGLLNRFTQDFYEEMETEN